MAAVSSSTAATTQPSAHVGINGQLLSASQTYRSAGVSGYIRQLLTHLPAAAPDLCFTAFVPAAAVDVAFELEVRLSRRWDTRRPLHRILWEQLALPMVARRAHLDLLHGAVNINPALGRCPGIITVHDLSFMRYPQAFPALQRIYLRTQVRRSAHCAQRVIAVSQATKQDVVDLFQVPDERIDVVYNGVDASFCPAPSVEVEAFRRRKGLPERYILHLGTLEPRKNLVRLVQAFHQARAERRDLAEVKLVLAGAKGWDYDLIFQEISRLALDHAVIFAGYVPDEELPWWYRAAACFAYPSLLEGFGLPVLEAMACGLPVITGRVSSLPEVAGDAALLVDPTSVPELTRALLSLLTDDQAADDLRQRGLARSVAFSWLRTAHETAAVYRKALNLPPHAPTTAPPRPRETHP